MESTDLWPAGSIPSHNRKDCVYVVAYIHIPVGVTTSACVHVWYTGT